MKLLQIFSIGICVFHLTMLPTSLAQNPIPSSEIVPTFKGEPSPYSKITQHQIKIGRDKVSYDAIAGETYLKDTAGNTTGSIFSFSYIRTDKVTANRPVLFVFNGGPGSASLWMHMGALGPKQLKLDKDVNPTSVPPFEIIDNKNSPLDYADLVFIDPIGTGFSRPLNGTDPKIFWGVDEDADSIAQFIELWLTQNKRWNSPKYVLGESYGSTRAAILPRALLGSPFPPGVMRGITLDGIILLGTTLDKHSATAPPKAQNEILKAHALRLPGIAVTAAFHGLTQPEEEIESFYNQTLEFSKTTYFEALLKADNGTLSINEKELILQKLKELTGLTEEQIGDDLVVTEGEFSNTALQNKGLQVGLYDSRYTLPLVNSGHDPVADDAAMTQYVPGFVAGFHMLLSEHLGVEIPRPYTAIRWKDLLPYWNFERGFTPVPAKNSAQELAWSLRRNKDLRVFVASGYYDLVTTPAAAYDQIQSGGVPLDRVTFKEYPSGHMLYLGGTSEAFSTDLKNFILQK